MPCSEVCGDHRVVGGGDWRRLVLKRDGTCVECGAPLQAGSAASWSRARRAVRCLIHGDEGLDSSATPAAATPVPPSVPNLAVTDVANPTAAGMSPLGGEKVAARTGDWRPLALMKAGTCVVCGAQIPARETASWSRTLRAVRCLAHDEARPVDTGAGPRPGVDPMAPADDAMGGPRATGTAGASALAEYERRAARREQGIRDRHPRLGGLILALSDEPQHVRAWKTGAAGERAVGRRLDELVADGVEVLHDRRIPGSRANIDHIAVSSSGVYVIDAKHYQGLVKVDWEGGLLSPRRYKLLVGRRDCTKLVTGVERQVDLVRAAVDRHAGAGGEVPVVGVLAFFDAEWPVLFPPDKINEVRLEGARSVRKLVRRAGSMSPEQVAATAAHLRSAFPEAAPPNG